jgi:hypothetical protein
MSTYNELVAKSKELDGKKERFKIAVNPALAQEILDGRELLEDFGLRQVLLVKILLKQYTEAMHTEQWKYGIGSISLALHRGRLIPINGNHTLKSIVASGTTQWMEVFLNAPIGDYVVQDNRGVERAPAEKLYTEFPDITTQQSLILGSIIPRAVLAIVSNTLGRDSAGIISDATTNEFFKNNKGDLLEAVNFVLSEKGLYRPHVALAYFLTLRQGVLDGPVLEFLSELRDGVPSRRNTSGFKFIRKMNREGKKFKQCNALRCIFYIVNRLLEGNKVGGVYEESAPFSIRVPIKRRTAKA